ncbi:hypothetical protein [Streptomyces triticisoli]|uniref:hypothetical protein n=1 Tax=Streptomyces triticisoli TaxID=2182797 RepID=UPI001E3F02FA|nr:hypothetical protein [Streptomyces triticisoli]
MRALIDEHPHLGVEPVLRELHTALAAVDGGAPLDAVTERTLVLVRRCLVPLGSTVDAPKGGH